MSDLTAGEPVAPEPRRGLSKPAVVVLVVVGVLLAAALVASLWKLPDYAIVPGTALDAEQLVTVPASLRQSHPGSVWLTDVDLVQLRAINYLFYRLNSNDSILPVQAVTGPATPTQYVTQGTIDMANARQAATKVALDALGYHVSAEPAGIIVYQPDPGSPAARSLHDDDVIVGVDGHPVTTFASLTAALHDPVPGTVVRVRVHPYGERATRVVAIRLGEGRVAGTTAGQPDVVCVPLGTRTPMQPYLLGGRPYGCLGITGLAEPAYTTTGLPFPVALDPHGIIGPSAGLAYTLALMAQLDGKDLTGGRRIAATGTMSMNGQIGDVGGVAQKTVAVRNAGATVFFVPEPELATARAHAGATLRVFAVSSMAQVLGDLRSIGGALSPPRQAAKHAP